MYAPETQFHLENAHARTCQEKVHQNANRNRNGKPLHRYALIGKQNGKTCQAPILSEMLSMEDAVSEYSSLYVFMLNIIIVRIV